MESRSTHKHKLYFNKSTVNQQWSTGMGETPWQTGICEEYENVEGVITESLYAPR